MSIDGHRAASELDDDDDLLAAVRAGDRHAYGELYARHASSARRYARSLLAHGPDADDAVAEVFARLLQAIERGRGPDHTFAAYLFASLRHECGRIERRRRREAVDGVVHGPAEPRGATGDHAARVAEAAVVRAAFASLPDEMRDILRLTEVDQVPPGEIATRLAEDPGTVATRAMRARRALSSAYLLQHVGIGGHQLPPGRGCDETQAHIASFLRGTAGSRRRARIEEHLTTCAACRAECADLRRINGHLRSVAFAALAAVRTAGEAAWSHLAAAAAASAAPLAATGVLTATTLGPVVIVPPPSSVPAPPAVVEEAPLPPELTGELHLPMGVAAEPGHPPLVEDTGSDASVPALDADTSTGRRPPTVTAAPAGPMIAEAVTVLPSVPTGAPPAAEDAAAEPAPEPDSDVSPSADARPSTDATEAAGAVADAPRVPPAEPSDDADVAAPEPPPPPPTAAPPPEVSVTAAPALAPASSDDGGAATTVPRKGGPGKAAPAGDEGGDTAAADVVTPARRVPTDVAPPLDAP